MLSCLLPSFGPCNSCFSVVFETLPVKWMQIPEWSPGFAESHAKACIVPESAFWQTTGKAVLCEMNKKIGCSYLSLVLSRAGILRFFLFLALLQAFILVLGVSCLNSQALTFFTSHKVGCTCPLNSLTWVFPRAVLPAFPRAQSPVRVLSSQSQEQFWGWCSSSNPRTSPGLALEVSQWGTSQISQSCLLAARPLLYQEFCWLAKTGLTELI